MTGRRRPEICRHVALPSVTVTEASQLPVGLQSASVPPAGSDGGHGPEALGNLALAVVAESEAHQLPVGQDRRGVPTACGHGRHSANAIGNVALTVIIAPETEKAATVCIHRARVPHARGDSTYMPKIRRRFTLAFVIASETHKVPLSLDSASVPPTSRHRDHCTKVWWDSALTVVIEAETNETATACLHSTSVPTSSCYR